MSWPKTYTRWNIGGTGYVSVPFTWCLPEVLELVTQGDAFISEWVVGGPAVKLMPDFLAGLPGVAVDVGDMTGVLQRVNPLATRTTLGCPRSCGFCGVSTIEPEYVELEEWPDMPILCDNNLTAASHEHFDKVMDRLDAHAEPDFNQGIDCRLLTEHHAERIGRHKGLVVRLALDHTSEYDDWERAWRMLRKYKTSKSRVRSYVLCGFDSGIDDAWERCEWVERHGALALPMWFHTLKALRYGEVTKQQKILGWSNEEKGRIMGYYYQHRGKPPEKVRPLVLAP